MMRLCCRARISLVEMLQSIASSPRNILCKFKENDQITGVVAEDEVETLVSSEVPGTEKSTLKLIGFEISSTQRKVK